MSTALYVSGLSPETTEETLRQAFSPFGEPSEVRVILDPATGRCRGFGSVAFEVDDDGEGEEAALQAAEELDGAELDGSRLVIRPSPRSTARKVSRPAAVSEGHAAQEEPTGPPSFRFRKQYEEIICGILGLELQGMEVEVWPALPAALREYYQLNGSSPINSEHNVMLAPDELEVEAGCLVFWVENQGVVSWGIRLEDVLQENPPVYVILDEESEPQQVHANLVDFVVCMVLFPSTFQYSRAKCDLSSKECERYRELIGQRLQVLTQNEEITFLGEPGFLVRVWRGSPDSDSSSVEWSSDQEDKVEEFERFLDSQS